MFPGSGSKTAGFPMINAREVEILRDDSAVDGSVSGTYCPYDVVPLTDRVPGTEFDVSTAFGRLHCLRSTSPAPEHSAERGRGTVFVHGVHDDMDSWGPLIHAAAQIGTDLGPMLFVDLPGFGRSENRRTKLDLAEIADAVMVVAATEIGFGSVRLVGHSMGTLVVLEMALRHPTLVESVHLAAGPYYSIVDVMNGRPRGGRAGALAAATFGTQALLALAGRPGVTAVRLAARVGLIRALLWPFVAHPRRVRQSVLDHVIADMRPASFRLAARNGFRFRHGMSWSTIRCPVWAVYGAVDRLVPAVDARRLRTDLPTATITTLPEAAHLLHLEQPHAALSALGLA